MNLRELNYFVAIGETQSMTKAADRLHIAQPAVTRHLKQLERKVGVRLTERVGRGIELTDAGRHLLRRVKPLLQELRLVAAEVGLVGREPTGSVSLGIPSSLSAIAGRFIERIDVEAPCCKLQVVDGWSRFIIDWLASRQLDLGIVYDHSCENPAIETAPLVREAHFLVGRPGSPFVRHPTIDGASLSRIPLILPSRRHGLRREADAYFDRLGRSPTLAFEIESVTMIRRMVERGDGYSIFSQSEIDSGAGAALQATAIAGPPFLRTLLLAWRRDTTVRPANGAIVAAIRSEVDAIVAEGVWGQALPDLSRIAADATTERLSGPTQHA